MAKRSERKRRKPPEPRKTRDDSASRASVGLEPNALALGLGGAGVVVAVVGYWLVAQGSITAAPLLLVLAYLVLLPLALIR